MIILDKSQLILCKSIKLPTYLRRYVFSKADYVLWAEVGYQSIIWPKIEWTHFSYGKCMECVSFKKCVKCARSNHVKIGRLRHVLWNSSNVCTNGYWILFSAATGYAPKCVYAPVRIRDKATPNKIRSFGTESEPKRLTLKLSSKNLKMECIDWRDRFYLTFSITSRYTLFVCSCQRLACA